jgi:hypothetical protein
MKLFKNGYSYERSGLGCVTYCQTTFLLSSGCLGLEKLIGLLTAGELLSSTLLRNGLRFSDLQRLKLSGHIAPKLS